MTNSNVPPVEVPGVTPEDGGPVIRRGKKGAAKSPMRPFIIMGVAALVMAGVLVVSWIQSMKPQVQESARTAPVAANVENPGLSATEDPTPAYREMVLEENRRASEAALSGEGGRAVVPPLLGERNAPRQPDPVVTFDDPPARQQPARTTGGAVDPKKVSALVAESRRLQAHWTSLGPAVSTQAAPLLVQRGAATDAAAAAGGAIGDGPQVPLFVVQTAVMETGANSDYPAPVVMRLTGGPLRGARIVGEFRASSTQGVSDRVQLRVSRIEVDGVVYQTDGLAVDPGTRIPAIEGDINRHLARNILARGSVAFLLGYAGGITSGARTSFSADGGFVTSSLRTGDLFRAEASREAASAASEIRIRQPTVTVPAGTPVGVVFLEGLKSAETSGASSRGYVAGAAPAPDAASRDATGGQLEFSTAEFE